MFTFGFSYVGVIYLLMLFIPNIIWAKNKPKGYDASDENKTLGFFERVGEALCTCCVLIFSDFNLHATKWIIWLLISFLLMVIYEIYWIRYFKSDKTLENFYKPMMGIPVPGASLPVMAFLILGIYGTNIFMIISSLILGIGHIGIHKGHCKKLNLPKSKRGFRIVKGVVFVALSMILMVISFFIGARNINYFNHYSLIQNGVDEGIYVEIGGQEQYLLIRGADKSNPVIVFLHGGPSSPESYVNYSWVNDLVDAYTVIDWDQRGCGRTYMNNCDVDSNNDSATYEQALLDLDELVDYACDRFDKKQVIIIGHSYGTVLASNYIEKHPDKVSLYIAIAQVVAMDINNRYLADQAISNAESTGENYSALSKALEDYNADPCVATTMALRQEAFTYFEEPLPEKTTWLALTSPYMGMADFEWFLKQLEPLDKYIELNRQLYDSLLDFNLYDVNVSENVPITYISGSLDYACPVQTIEDYIDKSGVNRTLYILDGCGHNVQYTKPHDVSYIIKDALSK